MADLMKLFKSGCKEHCGHQIGRAKNQHGPYAPEGSEGDIVTQCCHCALFKVGKKEWQKNLPCMEDELELLRKRGKTLFHSISPNGR